MYVYIKVLKSIIGTWEYINTKRREQSNGLSPRQGHAHNSREGSHVDAEEYGIAIPFFFSLDRVFTRCSDFFLFNSLFGLRFKD